ncbi:peptidoglycan DD-metalloendopeptidase family protein [Anaerotruncus rubiinfantis]|uniref:peptidoglycan DD-metalloendopeptidase family protein n=1 Tax=Anaerotruncus rubiinfantis TaxID=1720200 RepID=UPI0008347240|nr:peptidoglycan DD-metalloendopeptidase family protein [Anaerotruncus rubiinfantis]
MRVMMQCIRENNHSNLRFPCTEKELQILCDSLGVRNTAKTEVHIDIVHDDARLAALLSGKTVNLDELNYFMKRMDSFDEGERNTFHAAAAGQKLSTLREMINLTFNTHCYSVVDDFSDLDRLGKNLYLNQMGSVSTKELAEFDGRAYVEKMIAEHPQPLVTPYGLIYENGNRPQQLYNGRTFPAYWYEPNPITLSISKEKATEYLYLPVEKSEADKALQRLEAESLDEVVWSVEMHDLPNNLADVIITEKADFAHLNQFAAMLKERGVHEVNALSELAAFANITTAEQLKTLAECMYEFESFPGIHSAGEYGKYMICESGRFEYDENLADYIDFEAYGRDKISRETGAFTGRGYLLYHGYNQEMQSILGQTIGLKAKDMRGSFALLDGAIADLNAEMEDGDSLDSVRVKAIFYALYFGADSPSRKDHRLFAESFVTYEQRTRTVEYEDGTTGEETYTVAVPIRELPVVYANISTAMGVSVTPESQANASEIYYRALYGRPAPTYGQEFDEWSDGLPLSSAPFIGADGFCSPLGENWRSMVTSGFGYRKDPFTGQTKGHSGLDLGAPKGTSIRSALPGTVYVVRYSNSGYGYHVMVDHGGGFVTLYAHCSKILVTEGQSVDAGTVIAEVGSTGRSTGNHLHFEIRIGGEKQNPRSYLP